MPSTESNRPADASRTGTDKPVSDAHIPIPEREAREGGLTQAERESNPHRANPHPHQSAEVPYGSGDQSEPPGAGGKPSH